MIRPQRYRVVSLKRVARISNDLAARGHLLGDQFRRQLDQHDGRSLERLQEACSEADGHAIVLPKQFAVSRAYIDFSHTVDLDGRADILRQFILGRLQGRVPAGKDMADTPSRRQADIPYPAARLRRRNRVRRYRRVGRVIGDLDGQGRIAKQDIAAILERHLQGLAKKQRAKIPYNRQTDRPSTSPDCRVDTLAISPVSARFTLVTSART